MAIFRTFDDLVISKIEYLRLVQPELDTKPGTVSRDVFIDAPAQGIANLYSQLMGISGLQSLFSVTGSDLSKLASNYGASRIAGNNSGGTIVFVTNNMDVDILIPSGSIVTARNGINFETLDDVIMLSDSANVYKATSTRLRTDLDLASITGEFAIEVVVQALTSGVSGNIGRFSIISHNISGISDVTNLSSFTGGSSAESDDEFRTRILSIFAGSNTGTALGYSTAINIISGVLDSEIVVPGDPLLIRDGTQVSIDSDGNLIISDPGSGGKVDIYILGENLENQIDSFVFNDASGKNDPTDPLNDVILGQNGGDTTLNAAQRRVSLLAGNDIPNQPIKNIVTVSGSSSGSNFVEQYTDDNARVRGNYILQKDTGDFGGSPFGFDKLHWTSNKIELDNENTTKGIFNGSDNLNFADVEEIQSITQNYLITNENSTTSTTNRSSVILLNTPVQSVNRIVNLTTGERYVVENQNPDGTGELNETGRITISGSTLPVGTDILQVDYVWVKSFDSVFDFDDLEHFNSLRQVQDSIDWGFSNLVRREPVTLLEDAYGNLTATATHPIFKMISVDTFETYTTSVTGGSVVVNNTVSNVIDIRRVSDNAELFNTDKRGGTTLSGTASIVLPTDSIAVDGDIVTIRFNASDIFSSDGYDGTFELSTIILQQNSSTSGTEVLINYIADVNILIPESEITNLPYIKSNNKFTIGGSIIGEQPTSNLLDSDSNFTYNLRKSGSNLRVDIASTPSKGSITISGTTINKIVDTLVVVESGSGYEVDLQSAIALDLGTSIPSSVKVIKLVSLERVILDNTGAVTSVDNTYDIVNYKLRDNAYDLEVALEDSTLSTTKILIPQTSGNVVAMLGAGDTVRVSFYYIDTNYSTQLYFSKNGTQITNKVFVDISRITLGSGFKNATSNLVGNLTVKNFNQPVSNTSYHIDYNYIAPKENERITVTFNHNALINTITNSIENVRPITADVLIKEADKKDIDVSIKIVLLPEYINQFQTIRQDSIDIVSSFLNSNSLGTTVDASDIINILYSIPGIDRVRIITFSHGNSGNVLSISAKKNEYLDAGTVTIEVEDR
ncbi:hypothetical protein LCGC14_0636440 [marine sediment metagenome]|uniref:Uncharacterized protein n=1 Tax=marine sediment metagenome TaxID=412755 RepID=A0A0F9R5Q3_9ZZZZ